MTTRIRAAACAVIAATMSACGMTSSIPAPPHPALPDASKRIIESFGVASAMGSGGPDAFKEHISYHGGLVQANPTIYVSYWGFNARNSDPHGEQFYLTNFLEGIGGSAWLGDVTQYYEVINGFRKHVRNNADEMRGAWVDTTSIPRTPTDGQIQAAAKRLIAHFGFHRDATYVVATSHNHSTSGFGTQFCAYHNVVPRPTGAAPYWNFPYQADAGATCGANAVNPGSAGVLDGVSIVGGSLAADVQTDPFGNAWITSDGLEVGSDCTDANLRDITFSTGTFAIHGLWSNKRNLCSDSGP